MPVGRGWHILKWGACAAVVAAAAVLPSCRGQSRPRVVVYCTVDEEVARPILAEFERLTGIEVAARFDIEASKTVGLAKRLEEEAKDPSADVFWSNEIFYTIRLAKLGLLASHTGAETAQWPGRWADPQGRWYAFALRGRAIVYSTERVSQAEAPRKLEDLLEPKWRGRLVMARPVAGTTGGDVASWFVHYGPAQAREILEGLAANQVRLVDGNSLSVRQVANGQADVGLTDTDDVYAGLRNGWPIAMHPLDQGGAGALAIPNTAGLVTGAPHPREARELLAYLLSEAVERKLAESDAHNAPVRPALAAEFAKYALGQALEVDYAQVAEQLTPAIEAAKEVLR